MDCEFHFQLTKKAEADLDEIVAYFAVQRADPDWARRFLDQLQKAIGEEFQSRLARACPEDSRADASPAPRGRDVDAADEARVFSEGGFRSGNQFLSSVGVRRKLVGDYMMYYLPDEERGAIIVLRIIFIGRNWQRVLPQ